MTARPRPGARRRPAGTPTRLNLDVLVATFGLVDRVADGIAVTDLPHLRRCVAAGLVAVDPRGILALTPAGRSARDAHLAASPHLLRPANDVRPNPGAKRRTPAILRHCVAKVAGERGVSGAYAICTASLQRAGVMRGGKLTAAGRARDARHRRRTAENRAKDTAFEVALAGRYASKSASEKPANCTITLLNWGADHTRVLPKGKPLASRLQRAPRMALPCAPRS